MKLLPAKLSIPVPPPHVVQRQRLIDMCNAPQLPHLLLLQAPAGYGKSTLAAQVLGQFDGDRLWYTLDRRDADPETLTAYLRASLRPYLPALAVNSDSETNEMDSPDDAIDDICVVLDEHTGSDLCLVLDNFESVAESPSISEIVRRLLVYSSPKLHIVITSRVRPDIGVSKMIDTGQAITLHQEDLAFTLPEVRLAIARRKDLTLSEDELEQFWQDTGGWCVALGLRGRASGRVVSRPDSVATMVDFVAEEITAGHTPEFVDTLTHAAMLPELSRHLCSRLLGSEQKANVFLRQLESSPLPHTRDSEGRLRLHPMLREALIALWEKQTDASTRTSGLTAVVNALSEPAYLADAIDLCMEHQQYDQALDLIRSSWDTLIELDLVKRITDWLLSFPADYARTNLYVSLRADLLSLTGRNQELIDLLKSAYDPASFDRTDPAAFKLWIRYNWARLHTSTEPLYDRLCTDWQSLSHSHEASSRELLGWGEYTLACAAYMEMRLAAAEEHIHRCLEFFSDDAEVARANIRDQLAIFWHGQGRSHDALKMLEEIDRTLQQKSIFTGCAARHMYMAWIRISLGELHEGHRLVEHGLEMMRTHEPFDIRIEMYADRYRGVAHWYLGRSREGLEYLSRSLAAAEAHNAQEVPYSQSLLNYYSLLSGEHTPSSQVATNRAIPEFNFTQNTLVALTVDAALALDEQRYDDVTAIAETISGHAIKRGLVPWLVTGSFYLAASLEAVGRNEDAARHWHQGFATMIQLGSHSYPLNHPALTAQACSWALTQYPLREQAQQMANGDMIIDLADAIATRLAKRHSTASACAQLLDFATRHDVRGLRKQAEALRAATDPALVEMADAYLKRATNMPLPPLRIQTFGGYAVRVARRQVAHTRRNAERIMHILLLAFPRGVHEESLMEHLWPGADPVSARNNLRTCIKDLRRDLDSHYESRGPSYVVYNDEHYALALPEPTEIDFIAFRRRVRKAEALNDTSDPDAARRLELRREALRLCHGPLLPGARYESYAIDERERLVTEFLHCTRATAALLQRQSQYREAVAILEAGLETDPLWTDGVQLLMETWVQAGRTVNAIRAYRDYANRLQADLQVDPDHSLRHYFESLTETVS